MSALHFERRPDNPSWPGFAYGRLHHGSEALWMARSPEFRDALEAAVNRPRVWWRGDPQPEGVTRVLTSNREPVVLCSDDKWRRPDMKADGAHWDGMLDVFGLVVEDIDVVQPAPPVST